MSFAASLALCACNRAPTAANAAPGGDRADGTARAEQAAPPGAANLVPLPESDDGLPGSGPIRRYDWFRDLWRQRHEAWARSFDQDQHAVVFVGDSITQGWGDDMGGSFPGLKVANRGISGDTTRGILIRIQPDVVALHPSAVVILAGTNDLDEHAEPETIASNMGLVLAALKKGRPDLPVVLCEVFPSSTAQRRPKERILKVNQLYRSLVAGDPQVTLLETWALFADETGNAKPSEFPDLLHPNKIGYAKWAAVLRPILRPGGGVAGP